MYSEVVKLIYLSGKEKQRYITRYIVSFVFGWWYWRYKQTIEREVEWHHCDRVDCLKSRCATVKMQTCNCWNFSKSIFAFNCTIIQQRGKRGNVFVRSQTNKNGKRCNQMLWSGRYFAMSMWKCGNTEMW